MEKISDAIRHEIMDAYFSEMSVDDISKECGVSMSSVYMAWREAGFSKRPTQLQKMVYSLRKQGKCSSEIADELKIRTESATALAARVGLPFTEEEKRRSIELGIARRKRALEKTAIIRSQWFLDKIPGWEYVSGNVQGDGFVCIRHIACGNVCEKSAAVLRHHANPTCKYCVERKKEAKDAAKRDAQAAREEQRQKLKERRFWSSSFEQISFSVCQECGRDYLGGGKYCSQECQMRAHNKRKKDKRLAKIKDRCVDMDIDVRRLYERDGGVCWLCGGTCNFEDYTKDASGHFVVGHTYPSIDHVIPLSRGGVHSWENVKLAHHRCNSLKSDKVV